MAMVRGLHISTRKHSHTDSIQTIKYLVPLIFDIVGLENLSLLLSVRKQRDLSGHLMWGACPRACWRPSMSTQDKWWQSCMLCWWSSGEYHMSSCFTIYSKSRVSSLLTVQQERLCISGLFSSVLNLSFVSVLLSDGADFGRDGMRNFHSHHQWAEDNLHGVLLPRHQQLKCVCSNNLDDM
jgi:hypothetical protein